MFKIRSGYSFRKAAGKIEDVLDRLVEIGSKYAPITDTASTFGFYKFAKEAKTRNLEPAFGVELAVTNSINAKKPVVDYWTFMAQGDLGPINRLVEAATVNFRYQPLLTLEQAINATGVTKMTGHRPQIDLDGPLIDGVNIMLGPSSPVGVIRKAVANGWPLMASSDNRFPRKEDRSFYEVLCGRGAEVHSYDQNIQSEDEWFASIAHHGLPRSVLEAARERSEHALGIGGAELKKALLPRFPATKSLKELSLEGAQRLGCDLSRPEYAERLEKELNLIESKGYEDYFYIVADVVSWARGKMVVGPARGSSCGSLVCYLLGITTIDPIPFGLIFERFVDVNRIDMPDIDIDFSDQQRYMVFDYIRQKYGSENVARLGTVAMFQPRSALAEVGAALNIPKWKCDAVAESMIERSSGDARALNTLEDTLMTMPSGKRLLEEHPEAKIAMRFEGHPRHCSQHAAGIVISSEPITDFVAVDHRSGATMCDKKDAEDGYNLLKIDALGLTQLSVFEDALALAGLPLDHLDRIPLDDQSAFDVLNDQKWSGIFQFNGQALQSVAKMFKIDSFNDIVCIGALARPGPLASGGTNEWIKRRNKSAPVTYPHPLFEPYLKDTLGIVIFQETVMEIGRNIGDLDWSQVTALRKAMSKSLGKEFFDQYGDPWKKGAASKGIPNEISDKVWDNLCLSGDTEFISPFISKGIHKKITLKQLYERGGLAVGSYGTRQKKKRQKLLMYDGESLKPFENWGVFYSGKKMTYTVTTESGNKIHATEDHRFLQNDGTYKRLCEMEVGIDHVMSDSGAVIPTERKRKKGTGAGGHNWWNKLKEGAPNYRSNREYLKKMFKNCQYCHSAPYEETHHINMDHEDNRIENLLPICRKCHKKLHAVFSRYPAPWDKGRLIFEDKIISIEPRKIEDVYDVHMPDPYNNFLANGIIVHNCAYGSWSFNLSHSVAYGLISYWCCWLKAHFPFEFAAATLSHEYIPTRQIQLLREMSAEGFDYIPVDPEISGIKWAIGERNNGKVLVGPLTSVKGIGPKLTKDIIGAMERKEPLPDRARKLLTNPKTDIDSLWPIRDAFKRIMPDPTEMNIITRPISIIDAQKEEFEKSILLFCTPTRINPRNENEAILVAKRGYELKGDNLTYLNLFLSDDTETIFGKINRYNYDRLGKMIVERGRPGKSLYAIKGTLKGGDNFRMISINNVRYIGDIDS